MKMFQARSLGSYIKISAHSRDTFEARSFLVGLPVSFEAFPAVEFQVEIFRVVMPSSFVVGYQLHPED
jgi:hypothetical protein